MSNQEQFYRELAASAATEAIDALHSAVWAETFDQARLSEALAAAIYNRLSLDSAVPLDQDPPAHVKALIDADVATEAAA